MNEELIVTNEGKLMFNGQEATNEQLVYYFDYTKYTDINEQTYVEGILNNDTVSINDIKYSTVLDNNGHLISKDGQNSISPSKAKEIFGEKGYNALVVKKIKNVSIEDNIIKIEDKDVEDFKINEEKTEIEEKNSMENPNQEKEDEQKEDKKENEEKNKEKENKNSSKKNNNSSSSNSSHSSSSSGYYPSSSSSPTSSSSSSSSSSSNNDDSSKNSDEESSNEKKVDKDTSKTKRKNSGDSEKIVVDFAGLNRIKDDLKSCRKEIEEEFENFKSNVGSVSSSGAWQGDDADNYISVKNKYADNAKTISDTLNKFNNYLDKCITQYQELENELSGKFG